MIKKFRIGNPIETGAVVEDVTVEKGKIDEIGGISVDEAGYHIRLSEKAKIYGLGESMRGINKRGYKYTSFCTDDPSHTEEKESLYGAHNFFVVVQEEIRGFFFDNPGKIVFDMGFTKTDEILCTPKYQDSDIYVIEGESITGVVKEFRRIIGKSYIPPMWAFGFGQSRWSYENKDRVNEVVEGYEKCDMPITSVYMDIDYMEEYKDFTVSEERFPDFKNYVGDLKNRGIRLVPIIDAGVKIQEGYQVYEEGIKNNYFVKDENGKDYVTAVWPGWTHFPDFLNTGARKWFGDYYKKLIDLGIEGFWNDMNEPAIFYSRRKVDELRELLKNTDFEDDNDFVNLKYKFRELSNNPDDYNAMYHNMDGVKINHDRVHNLYGYKMTDAAGEAFERNYPDRKFLMFSRASYIGMHRKAGLWMGDNCSWWSHILLNLKMLPGLNMCGFLYTGADIGGFGCNASEELVLRWMALGVFTPLMRNHSAMGTRNQECFRFDDKAGFKNILYTRYRLIPYLYKVYVDAATNDDMMFKPLAVEFDDEISADIEDQLLLGDIMIAPVYEQNRSGRYVYLPENMTFAKFQPEGKLYTEKMEKGVHYINVDTDEVPLFVRDGVKIPVVKYDIVTEKSNRAKIQDCSMEYKDEDFEMI